MSRIRIIQYAAKLSFITPLLAVVFVLLARSIPSDLSARYFRMGFGFFLISAFGVAAALLALFGMKQLGTKGVGFRATVGLIANAAILLAFMTPA